MPGCGHLAEAAQAAMTRAPPLSRSRRRESRQPERRRVSSLTPPLPTIGNGGVSRVKRRPNSPLVHARRRILGGDGAGSRGACATAEPLAPSRVASTRAAASLLVDTTIAHHWQTRHVTSVSDAASTMRMLGEPTRPPPTRRLRSRRRDLAEIDFYVARYAACCRAPRYAATRDEVASRRE